MNVYTLIALGPNPALDSAVSQKFSNNFYKLSDTAWLVAGNGTAQDVSTLLGITDGTVQSTLVFATSSYYGRAPMDIWDWVKAKLEAPAHA